MDTGKNRGGTKMGCREVGGQKRVPWFGGAINRATGGEGGRVVGRVMWRGRSEEGKMVG